MTKKVGLLSLLFFVTLFVQNASATLEPMLPESSHYDGSTYYNIPTDKGNMRGRIDFAVYNTADLQLSGETDLTTALDLPGQFVYAYQIFNDYEDFSEREISYFAIFGIDGLALDVDDYSIDAANDSPTDPALEGVEPSAWYFEDSNTRGVWEFEGGSLIVGEHSWFLVFSSSQDWTRGRYELKTAQIIVPGGESGGEASSPEPCTIALLGIGTVLLTRLRKPAA